MIEYEGEEAYKSTEMTKVESQTITQHDADQIITALGFGALGPLANNIYFKLGNELLQDEANTDESRLNIIVSAYRENSITRPFAVKKDKYADKEVIDFATTLLDMVEKSGKDFVIDPQVQDNLFPTGFDAKEIAQAKDKFDDIKEDIVRIRKKKEFKFSFYEFGPGAVPALPTAKPQPAA